MPSFLLEVGTEELPAGFVGSAITQWETIIPETLKTAKLKYTDLQVYATPRRLGVLIKDLPQRQSDRTEEVKGPPALAAFRDGTPTPAAIGFANKQGVKVEDLTIKPTDKGEFVFINKLITGQETTQIITDLIPQWISQLEGKRFMRWADGNLRFSRPIRWLVSLWDQDILPINIINNQEEISSDRISRTHRVLHPEPVIINQVDDYVSTLKSGYVLVDPKERETLILEQINQAATQMGGYTEIYPDLLAEVINLVEYPTAVVGKFDPEFLSLPQEVITTVMVTHQRYFPLFEDEQKTKLLPYFITISNGDPAKKDIIADGNGRVVRARLADGEYFYQADLNKPLADYVEKLESVTFQADLGSMAKKVSRIVNNAKLITKQLNLSSQDAQKISRAAYLCKADLVTQMVGEFPELQGIMGSKYAIVNGEDILVAEAIREHYLPRNVDDQLPVTTVGQIVGIADRLDTLISIFSLGMLPTGSSDPFALRRSANAIINIIWSANLSINLNEVLHDTIADFATVRSQTNIIELTKQLQEFFRQRIRNLLQDDRQIDYDLVNAVLGESDQESLDRALTDLLDLRDRAIFLQQIRNNHQLDTIYETVNRSTRLAVQGNLDYQQLNPLNLIDPQLFQKKSEQAFYDSLIQLLPQTQTAKSTRNYQLLIDSLSAIAPTVSKFFDGEDSVLVMDPDPRIKNNRLNLLGILRNHARVLGDFGEIVKS